MIGADRPSQSHLNEVGILNGQTVFRAVCLIALAVVVHLPALPGDFFWDDYDWIVDNPRVRESDGLRRLWTEWDQYDYWPLHYSMHWFEWRLWGEWAAPFRLLNQFWHALDCLLVWLLLARLRVPGAYLIAILFAVHPVNVESVAWVSQRKTVQSTAGAFVSLACLLRYIDTLHARWYVASVLAFLFGLLTKTSVVMWPLALLLCLAWYRRRFTLGDVRVIAPMLLISLVLGLAGTLMRGEQQGIEYARDDGLASRLAIAGRAVWFYAEKTVWPLELSVVYPRWELGRTDLVAFLPLVALIAVLGIAWKYRRRWGLAVFVAMGYFVVNLFPALGFIGYMFQRYSLVGDHYQYLAMPGLLALLVGGAATLIVHRPPMRLPALVLAVVVAGFLSWQSFERSRLWSADDSEPIWRDALETNPDGELPNRRLGYVLAVRGEFREAVELICKAERTAVPPVPWGPPRVDPQRLEDATGHRFEKIGLEQTSEDVRIAYAMGTSLYVMGQEQLAGDFLFTIAKQAPGFAGAPYNLALVTAAMGDQEQSKKWYLQAEALAELSTAD